MTTLFVDRETTISASWLNAADAIVTDPAITAIAGVTPAADQLPYFTGTAAAALASLTSFARTLLDDANAASARATLEAQGLDAELTAIAGLVSAADKLPYFTGLGSAALASFTATGRSLVSTANVGEVLTLIGAIGDTDPVINGSVTVSGAAATDRAFNLTTAGTARWSALANITAEAGANAGSDFELRRYNDAGGLLGAALMIVRSSGLMTVGGALTATGTLTASGALNVTGLLTASAALVAKTIGFAAVIDDGNSSTSDTIDFTAGQYHKSTMTGNCAFTYTAPTYPCVVQHEIIQGSGGHTFTTTPTLLWPDTYAAADKLLSTAAGARDLLVLRWNGTDYIANLLKGIA